MISIEYVQWRKKNKNNKTNEFCFAPFDPKPIYTIALLFYLTISLLL